MEFVTDDLTEELTDRSARDPDEVGPDPTEVGQAEVGQAEVGQAEVGQAEVGQAEVGQAEYGDVEALELDLDLEPPPPEVRGLPSHLSPSSASTFSQCARRWKFRYIDRLPDPPGEAALVGTFAHRVLELLLQEPPGRRTLDNAKRIARTSWDEIERHPEYRALGNDTTAGRAFRWRGWLAIEGLWRIEDPTSVVVEATEQDVRVTLADVPFRGIIDRLDITDAGFVVTDYKSGRAPSARFADARLQQVLLYAAAVNETTGQLPARARLLYLGQRIIETRVDEEILARSTAELAQTWDDLSVACSTDEYAPSTGPLCAWCPFVAHCPEGRAEVTLRHQAGRVRGDAPALAVLPEAS